MISYAVATDLLTLLHACGEKSVPRAAFGSGVGLRDGSGMPVGTSAVETKSAPGANQPVAGVGVRMRITDVPGPPPRGAPV